MEAALFLMCLESVLAASKRQVGCSGVANASVWCTAVGIARRLIGQHTNQAAHSVELQHALNSKSLVSTGMGDLQSKLLTVDKAKKPKADADVHKRKQRKLLEAEQPKTI